MITAYAGELIGPALDWAVAVAEKMAVQVITIDEQLNQISLDDYTPEQLAMLPGVMKHRVRLTDFGCSRSFSTDWNHCGPLIDKYMDSKGLTFGKPYGRDKKGVIATWAGSIKPYWGENTMIAFLRLHVASELGEQLQVPAVLIQARHEVHSTGAAPA